MLLRYPAYYEKFRCIAAACPDSCCKDWSVEVDETSAVRYLALEGELGAALRRALRQEDEVWFFEIEDGRCPFWQADGLCRIQGALDHEALCGTCREFPRLKHDYGSFVEKGLCMSCPEAARLIFAGDGAWLEQEIPGGEAPEYQVSDMECLLRTRRQVCEILKNPAYTVPQALTLALLYGYRAQELLDGGADGPFDPASELAFAASMAKQADISELVAFYGKLEILTDRWRQRLASPQGGRDWPEALRTLAIYGVQRYWLQAISDFDLVGRVKLVIAGCLLVRQLGGDIQQTAQLYAKEIENDQDNVETILDGAYGSPALTDEKLLGWLRL